MLRRGRGHDFHIVANEAFADRYMELRMALPQVPSDRFHWFNTPPHDEFSAPAMVQLGERFRERFVTRVQPDILHITSLMEGLNDAARTSIGMVPGLREPLNSVTLYDLIPFLRQDPYLVNADVRAWYYRKIVSLKRAGLALAISDYARQEAIDALELDPERVVAISCGADPLFEPVDWKPEEREALLIGYDLTKPYVMYTGGDDERKNLKGLIAAWAAVPAELRTKHQLLIVCKLSDPRRVELRQYSVEQGMSLGELVLPGTFVPDQDLRRLYAACALFVFPSLHEGFGLPVLEAMLCGAPVIAANTSSLPEVLGRADALFDPKSKESIRDAITNALSDPAKLAAWRAHAPIQAAKFSWELSAERALDGFEMAHAREQFEAKTRIAVPDAANRRLAVALSEDMPADDVLLPTLEALASQYQIEVVAPEPVSPALAARFASRQPEWAAAHAARYAQVVHVVGPQEGLTELTARVRAWPGSVVLPGLGNVAPAAQADADSFELQGAGAVQALHQDTVVAERLGKPASLSLLDLAPALFASDAIVQQHLITAFGDIRVLSCDGLDSLLTGLVGSNRRLALVLGEDVPPVAALLPLLEALAGQFQVELVSPTPPAGELSARFAWRASAAALADPARYARAVHIMGPEEGLDAIAARVRAMPGPVVLYGLGDSAPAPEVGFDTLFDLHGWRASQAVRDGGLEDARQRMPATLALLDLAPALFAADTIVQHRLITAFGETPVADIRVLGFDGLEALLALLARTPAGKALPAAGHRTRHFYVDVSMVVREDLRTGIQRAVRSILMALPAQLPEGWVLVPVCANEEFGYVYADAMLGDWLDLPMPGPVHGRNWSAVTPVAGDFFLGLDWSPQATIDVQPHLAAWRAKGVRTAFVVYDLLPVLQPAYFPAEISALFGQWLGAIGRHADVLIAISKSVADETRDWYAAHPEALEGQTPRIGHFHLGADLDASRPSTEPDTTATEALASLLPGRTLLTVATVEPRKGHMDVLDALDSLWADDAAINWIVVGKPGWDNDEIVARLQAHPQSGKRLVWLSAASDAVLADAYRRADLLLVPSHGEGFGLPLIEGAQAGLPLIVRDLPVFHEVAGANASYFSNNAELVALLQAWLAGTEVPASSALARQTWAASTRELVSVLLGQRLPV
jgi:glycosyltransferase involved in cell wall biosynthesis